MARREAPGCHLVTEQLQRAHARTDEDQARFRASRSELRDLGQESVSGMDRVATGLPRLRDDLLGIEVGARTLAR